jgi:hypothetical protein
LRLVVSRLGRSIVSILTMMVMCSPLVVGAAEGPENTKSKPLEERNLWRLEWDNDAFVRVDNGFTNGWSVQRHSHQHNRWQDMAPSKFSGWISRTIPGLDDDGNRVVKRGTGLSQIMMTPEDLENPNPQPGDVPWAGSLGWAESWYAFDNQTLNAFQIYFGILGPTSRWGGTTSSQRSRCSTSITASNTRLSQPVSTLQRPFPGILRSASKGRWAIS